MRRPHPSSISFLLSIPLTVLADPSARAATVPVGAGSYTTTLPPGGAVPTDTAGMPVIPLRTANVTGPPTNDWWTSMIWARRAENPDRAYSENMYAHPLCFKACAQGLQMRYPTECVAWSEYHYALRPSWGQGPDLTVGLAGLTSPDTKVEAFSDWTATGYWDDGARTLRATFGHGLPFVYLTGSGDDAQVTINADGGEYTVWHNAGSVVGVTVRGHYYGIFGPTGCTWSLDGNVLRSNLSGKDYFAVALLPDEAESDREAALMLYGHYAFAFVVDTRVSYSYDTAGAALTTTYTLTTTPKEGSPADTLIALYRHQWMNSAEPLTRYTYTSPRGIMKVRAGTFFSTRMTFNGVLPGLPDVGTYDRGRLYSYVDNVYREGNLTPNAPDTYWWGKTLGRSAALVRIADQIGHPSARDFFLGQIKMVLENWLTASPGETGRLFYYNDTWGTLIGFPSSFATDKEINDHHFHYGYFVMAAATVAQYDPAWAADSQWGGMIKMLIRDVASRDRRDPLFPWMRYFDPYAGHSWASGHGADHEGYRGNNQESSSESMNFSTGLILFGAATGDTELRDQGIFMYVNEMHAIEQYWFDVDQQVFCPQFSHPVLGILWGSGGQYGTWWTSNPEEIHGINFLPITGGSLYLGRRPDYLLKNYNHMVAQNGGPPQEWRDIIWSVNALRDAAQAVAWFDADPDYVPEAGETKAHTYHWLHNLDAMGSLDTRVTADTPTYAVFSKGGDRTYVAYNPANTRATVHYSDSMVMNVDPGQLRAIKVHQADLDHDGDVDHDDFLSFESCATGPDVPLSSGCEAKDFDHDGDVDQSDFALFQRCYSGEGNPPDPTCVD